jgi:hypothetical protein
MQAVPAIRSRILAQWRPNIFRGYRTSRRGSSNEIGRQFINLSSVEKGKVLETGVEKPQVVRLPTSTKIALVLSSKNLWSACTTLYLQPVTYGYPLSVHSYDLPGADSIPCCCADDFEADVRSIRTVEKLVSLAVVIFDILS